jgi:hypothetical protein
VICGLSWVKWYDCIALLIIGQIWGCKLGEGDMGGDRGERSRLYIVGWRGYFREFRKINLVD